MSFLFAQPANEAARACSGVLAFRAPVALPPFAPAAQEKCDLETVSPQHGHFILVVFGVVFIFWRTVENSKAADFAVRAPMRHAAVWVSLLDFLLRLNLWQVVKLSLVHAPNYTQGLALVNSQFPLNKGEL